jgi:hypothetical protein
MVFVMDADYSTFPQPDNAAPQTASKVDRFVQSRPLRPEADRGIRLRSKRSTLQAAYYGRSTLGLFRRQRGVAHVQRVFIRLQPGILRIRRDVIPKAAEALRRPHQVVVAFALPDTAGAAQLPVDSSR